MDNSFEINNAYIESDRLVLRNWRMSDLHDFYQFASIPIVGNMAGWSYHKSMEESEKILSCYVNNSNRFALVLKKTYQVIGTLSLEQSKSERIDIKLQGGKLGFALHPDYWGKEYMPEAVKTIMQYCFRVLNYDYLRCGHFERNYRSKRVIEKCGFSYLEEFDQVVNTGELEHIIRYIVFNPTKES